MKITATEELKPEDIPPLDGLQVYIDAIAERFVTVFTDEAGTIRRTPTQLLTTFAPGSGYEADDVNHFIMRMKLKGLMPVTECSETEFDFVYYLKSK